MQMWPLKWNIEQTSIARVNVNSWAIFQWTNWWNNEEEKILKRYDHNEILLNKAYYA